jgi:tetratricopeptide (TPR) repeat protein
MAKVNLQPYWEFFKAERWADAEEFLRRQIEACGPGDADLLVHLQQLLGGTLAKLGRSSEATASSRSAVEAAQRQGQPINSIAIARYTHACQLLAAGDADAALHEAQEALPLYKPVEFHLHTVSAEALSQLGRHSEARVAALAAVAAAPNDIERETTRRNVEEILGREGTGKHGVATDD